MKTLFVFILIILVVLAPKPRRRTKAKTSKKTTTKSQQKKAEPKVPQAGWGILSTAWIAKKLSWAIEETENAKLVAVGSRTLSKAKDFTKKSGARAYGDYNKVIEDKRVDIVYVPLPTSIEPKWVVKACKAGKHVLADKPFTNTKLTSAMVRVCQKSGVQFLDATMFVHHPRTEEALKRISELGEITNVHSEFFTSLADEGKTKGNIRYNTKLEPHGALGDLGWYTIRFNLLALDYNLPQRVFCHAIKNDKNVITQVHGVMDYTTFTATFKAGFEAHEHQSAEVIGTKGVVHVPNFVVSNFKSTSLSQSRSKWKKFDYKTFSSKVDYKDEVPVKNLVKYLSEIALTKETVEKWGEQSIKTMKVLDGCTNSIKNNGWFLIKDDTKSAPKPEL